MVLRRMQLAPELEVLDQLLGGDLPLNVIVDLFHNIERCQRAVSAMLHNGDISIISQSGQKIPSWRYRELQSVPQFWAQGTSYRLSITDAGAKRIT